MQVDWTFAIAGLSSNSLSATKRHQSHFQALDESISVTMVLAYRAHLARSTGYALYTSTHLYWTAHDVARTWVHLWPQLQWPRDFPTKNWDRYRCRSCWCDVSADGCDAGTDISPDFHCSNSACNAATWNANHTAFQRCDGQTKHGHRLHYTH